MTKRTTVFLFTSILVLLVGCSTLPSADNVFENNISEENVASIDKIPALSLEEALEYMQSDLLERFWFRAHIANNIEKRRITYMTQNGIVIRPHGYYMKNSLITKPYEYYRWDDETFIRVNQNWFRGREPELPFDIFYGFEEWEPYVNQAELIREDQVLSVPTDVYQIELSGTELLEIDTPIFQDIINELEPMSPILEDTTVRVLFYVGDIGKSTEDHEVLPIIYKYQTWIQMPVPGAGYMEQEVQYFLFRVNDENVEMTSIEDIEKYVIEIDTFNERMNEQLDNEIERLSLIDE